MSRNVDLHDFENIRGFPDFATVDVWEIACVVVDERLHGRFGVRVELRGGGGIASKDLSREEANSVAKEITKIWGSVVYPLV
ncbi:MAG TPA: hypothetical protein VLB83_03010 [Candidatus Paceibacterota bacterium]|nr:hypothetical protein [Candidatus Paceibacterota bacterium]